MKTRWFGMAPLWALSRWIVVGALALGAGCARYERKPLMTEEFRQALAARTPDSPAMQQEITDHTYAPADGLTLGEAEQLCLILNPRLRTARAEAQVPAASAKFAGLWDDPEFSADVLRIVENAQDLDAP